VRERLIEGVRPVRSLLDALVRLPWQAADGHPVLEAPQLRLLGNLYAHHQRHLPTDTRIFLGRVWQVIFAGPDRERAFCAFEVATLLALRGGAPAARIAQARHAAPKLGRNIRLVTRNKVVGSLGPDGRLKFLSAGASAAIPNADRGRAAVFLGGHRAPHAARRHGAKAGGNVSAGQKQIMLNPDNGPVSTHQGHPRRVALDRNPLPG
jgi:hypothetical protein